ERAGAGLGRPRSGGAGRRPGRGPAGPPAPLRREPARARLDVRDRPAAGVGAGPPRAAVRARPGPRRRRGHRGQHPGRRAVPRLRVRGEGRRPPLRRPARQPAAPPHPARPLRQHRPGPARRPAAGPAPGPRAAGARGGPRVRPGAAEPGSAGRAGGLRPGGPRRGRQRRRRPAGRGRRAQGRRGAGGRPRGAGRGGAGRRHRRGRPVVAAAGGTRLHLPRPARLGAGRLRRQRHQPVRADHRRVRAHHRAGGPRRERRAAGRGAGAPLEDPTHRDHHRQQGPHPDPDGHRAPRRGGGGGLAAVRLPAAEHRRRLGRGAGPVRERGVQRPVQGPLREPQAGLRRHPPPDHGVPDGRRAARDPDRGEPGAVPRPRPRHRDARLLRGLRTRLLRPRALLRVEEPGGRPAGVPRGRAGRPAGRCGAAM
ncbi:MAG: hypothetical protein AVDCRST_MAG48-2719, partial [uncultured Friedmanniella sp.]